jgi:hypothetical protein
MATSAARTRRTSKATTRTAAGGSRKGASPKAKPAARAAAKPPADDAPAPPATGERAISLDDLSDAQRAELLAELADRKEEVSNVRRARAAEESVDRTEAIRGLLDTRDHLRACPNDGRVELYPAPAPEDKKRGLPPREVTVVRCVECAGSTVIERRAAEVLAELDQSEE